MNLLVPITNSATQPAIVTAAGGGAKICFLEFFAALIRPRTRRVYGRAVGEFLTWCEGMGVTSIAAIKPLHIAAYIEAPCPRRNCARGLRDRALIRLMVFSFARIGSALG
jgi:predicted phosphoadenosine phosphosulfate sulfurtransferase